MENNKLSLDDLRGKFVKAVFREAPSSPIEVRKGLLIAYDAEFIQIKSVENIHVINRGCVISLKAFGCAEASQ